MIKQPENDRPIVETFPWSHLGVAGLAWSALWFLVWSIAEGLPASVIVSIVPDHNYRFLPYTLLGVFMLWLMATVHTQGRLRRGRDLSPIAFSLAILLLLFWPPACYWARSILKAIPAVEIGRNVVAYGFMRAVEDGVPWVTALVVTMAIGIPANHEIAQAVYNRTMEHWMNAGVLAYALATVPGIICTLVVGPYLGFVAYGVVANALMLMWYRHRLKEEIANNRLQRISDPRHASCGARVAPESEIR